MTSDDDFGPFVGPLDLPPSPERHPPHKKFLADAKANTDRNRKAVLDELLVHQDDPLYWHKPSVSVPTPAPPIASTPSILSTPPEHPESSSTRFTLLHERHSTLPDHISSSPSSASSWFATLHERIPSTHNALPSLTRSFFSQGTTPSSSSISTTKSVPTPFAPHIFTPIPGAPGFKPDEYDWDKGFSTELEQEIIADAAGPAAAASTAHHVPFSSPQPPTTLLGVATPEIEKTPSPPVPLNFGEYIEKKSGGVELVGRRMSTIPVLTSTIADKIRPYLPALSRLPRTWTLIYSLDQHGISLKTLYAKCEAAATTAAGAARSKSTHKIHGMLFVVKDSDGGIFGSWISEGLRMSRGNEGYYGSGDSFLWKWVEDSRSGGGGGGGELGVFKWTGKNDYVALCESSAISFGGGDGSYGLYLDDTLFEGTSARSITFSNDVLCSMSGPRLAGGAVGFECVGVEVWGVSS